MVGPKPLTDELLTSAARFAQSALRAFLDRDLPIFVLHAGTALEHLTKGYLASLDASLIASTDFDSLLQARGLALRSRRRPSRMKTISLTVALDRAGQHFIPALHNLTKKLALLVDVRNGVAHIGSVNAGEAESVLVPFLQACEVLLTELGAERSDFWGEFGEVVDARLSESTKAAEIRVSEALAVGRVEFQSRYSEMEPSERDVVLRAVEGSYQVEPYKEDLIACPACGRLAIASGGYAVSWEAEWERGDLDEPTFAGVYPTVKIVPSTLKCRVCGLQLSGQAELQAADMPESWEIKNVDPDDFEAERQAMVDEESELARWFYDLND